jgi:hypothetical protein
MHFGHFQASCNDVDLCSMDRWMAEMSLKTGYPLCRWKQGIDVMIPKKSGSIRVDKLRTDVICTMGTCLSLQIGTLGKGTYSTTYHRLCTADVEYLTGSSYHITKNTCKVISVTYNLESVCVTATAAFLFNSN